MLPLLLSAALVLLQGRVATHHVTPGCTPEAAHTTSLPRHTRECYVGMCDGDCVNCVYVALTVTCVRCGGGCVTCVKCGSDCYLCKVWWWLCYLCKVWQ